MHTSLTSSSFRSAGLRAGLFLVCAWAALATPLSAMASHYRLPVAHLIEADETALLKEHGIQTTLALLNRVAKTADRKKLAKESGLSLERIEALARQVDLLRIEGVGPSMVLVLQAAGVRDTRDLSRTNASALLTKMKAANERERITEVLPREPGLHAWILQARKLPVLLEGLGR